MNKDLRYPFIDIAKGIGIILVVYAHLPAAFPNLVIYFYSFHIPLFFFITGLFISNKNIFYNIFIKLFIPYLIFSFISICFFILQNKILNYQINYSFLDFLFRVIEGNYFSLIFNGVLWFFPALIVSYFVFCICISFTTFLKFLFLVLLLIIYFCFIDLIPNYFSIQSGIVGSIFLLTANLYKDNFFNYLKNTSNKNIFFMVIFFIIASYLMSSYNERVDLATNIYSFKPLYLINAFLGIFAIIGLSFIINKSLPLQKIGKESLFIFPLHLIVISLLNGAGQILFHQDPGFQHTIFYSFIYVVISISVCIGIAYLYKKIAH